MAPKDAATASTVEKAASSTDQPRKTPFSWAGVQNAVKNVCQTNVFDLLLDRHAVTGSGGGRRVPLAIEHPEPLVDARRGHGYISNDIRTSRYTVFDFIPKQLFFQFSRVGNFYFLCVGVPQMVSSNHHWMDVAFTTCDDTPRCIKNV